MDWSWLFFWKRRSGVPAKLPALCLFTRKDCPLCEEAWKILQAERKRLPFHLDIVDVDSQADLAEKFGSCVPVLTVNGRVRFRGKINPVLLARIFVAETGKTNPEGE